MTSDSLLRLGGCDVILSTMVNDLNPRDNRRLQHEMKENVRKRIVRFRCLINSTVPHTYRKCTHYSRSRSVMDDDVLLP